LGISFRTERSAADAGVLRFLAEIIVRPLYMIQSGWARRSAVV
jgi:hypothetical protein